MQISKSLKDVFAKAANTELGQAFIRHAGKIACGSFFAGDLALGLKDYIQSGRVPNIHKQMSAGAFFLTDILMATSDRYPEVKPYIGWVMLAASGLLGYSGVGADGQNAQLFSSALVGVQALSFIGEQQLQSAVAKHEHSENGWLRKIFTPLAKYPLVTTAAVDIVGKVALGAAAIQKGDVGLLVTSGVYILGDTAVMAMDNNVKALLNEQKSQQPPVPIHS